ncbi:MAG: SH3 domain-containing protein [Bacteroidales bacterium]|nr:SH3 domain-containing protein [Bacteroidales bacterium]
MTLKEKYQPIIDAATQAGANLQVTEQNDVLYIQGEVPSGAVKDKLWEVYGSIDPTFSAGDLVLDVNAAVAEGGKVRVITKQSNLNIRKGPGTDQPIVGKAAKDEIITLVSKSNDQWWLVRTNDGEEGYSYAAYLEPLA